MRCIFTRYDRVLFRQFAISLDCKCCNKARHFRQILLMQKCVFSDLPPAQRGGRWLRARQREQTGGGRVPNLHARKLRWNATDAERELWWLLRRKQLAGFRIRRQATLGPYIADFFCAKARLIVELDGARFTFLPHLGEVVRSTGGGTAEYDWASGPVRKMLQHIRQTPAKSLSDYLAMDDVDIKSKSFAKQLRGRLTNAETILWSRLRRNAIHGRRFRRQHPIGPYIADFACMPIRLVVEVDGATHGSEEERRHDQIREDYLRQHGWHVLRIWNADVFDNLDGVLETIHNAVAARMR